MAFHGVVAVEGSNAFPLFFVVYQGSSTATLHTQFRGTIVAPFAELVLSASNAPHQGGFFARGIEVKANTNVHHVPFMPEP
jgi:hypothetical protein